MKSQDGTALAQEIEQELRNCNASLQRLGTVLASSNLIPRELFQEFRDAVNRVRVSAWVAEQSLADRQGSTHEHLLAHERVRAITAMCEQVAEYLSVHEPQEFEGLERLSEAITKLSVLIQLRSKSTGV